MAYGIVYCITNSVNGKVYIGQTIRTAQWRFRTHIQHSRSGERNYPIYAATRKYGEDAFSIAIIEECNTQDELNDREQYWIAEYKSLDRKHGYNLRGGGARGSFHEESKRKNRFYKEIDINAVADALRGDASVRDICKQFNIHHGNLLKKFVAKYHCTPEEYRRTTLGQEHSAQYKIIDEKELRALLVGPDRLCVVAKKLGIGTMTLHAKCKELYGLSASQLRVKYLSEDGKRLANGKGYPKESTPSHISMLTRENRIGITRPHADRSSLTLPF